MRRAGIALSLCLAGCQLVFGHRSDDKSPDAPIDDDDAAIDAPRDVTLIAHYPMDDLAGNILKDVSGNNHDGTCSAAERPTVVPGRIGQGLSFDGAQMCTIASTPMLEALGDAFTIAMWVDYRHPAGPPPLFCPAGKAYVANSNPMLNANSWALCFANDVPQFATLHGTESIHTSTSGSLPFPQLTPTHVALVWDGVTRTLYIGGAFDADDVPMMAPVRFDDHPISIGADIDGGVRSQAFIGVLDDVRIYSRALSVSEITQLANP